MIGTIQGTIRHKDIRSLIVDVGGVGYKVAVTTDTSLGLENGDSIFLWTYLAVRENALDLYGFIDKDTKDVFELLITISGIGPKTALSILNVATPKTLRKAVANDDTSYLTKVSGIGKKNAEKIVLELRDKLNITSEDKSENLRAEGDVVEALVSLGYKERDIREVLKKMPKSKGNENAGEMVRQALKLLSDKNG